MNSFVVSLMNAAESGVKRHASERALWGYGSLHHLLLALAEKHVRLRQLADYLVGDFVRGEAARSKHNCADLGQFLMLLTVAPRPWAEVVEPVLMEAAARNVLWVDRAKTKPLDKFSAQDWFDATKTSKRLLMFQTFFLRLSTDLATYNRRFGHPTEAQQSTLVNTCRAILAVNSWPAFFARVGARPRDPRAVMQELCDAIARSLMLGYHGSSAKGKGKGKGAPGNRKGWIGRVMAVANGREFQFAPDEAAFRKRLAQQVQAQRQEAARQCEEEARALEAAREEAAREEARALEAARQEAARAQREREEAARQEAAQRAQAAAQREQMGAPRRPAAPPPPPPAPLDAEKFDAGTSTPTTAPPTATAPPTPVDELPAPVSVPTPPRPAAAPVDSWTAAGPKKSQLRPASAVAAYEAARAALKQAAAQRVAPPPVPIIAPVEPPAQAPAPLPEPTAPAPEAPAPEEAWTAIERRGAPRRPAQAAPPVAPTAAPNRFALLEAGGPTEEPRSQPVTEEEARAAAEKRK